MAFEVAGLTDDDKENEMSAFAKRERKKDDALFLAGIRDIIAYIMFLILYTIVLQTSGVELAFPMASKMRAEVLGDGEFEGILVVDDVWDYLDGHFVDKTFLDEGDDGLVEEIPSGRWGYILDMNRMIGAIQFEQKRVYVGGALPWNATPSCKVPQVFAEEIDKCYPSIAEGGHATTPFGGSCGCDTSMFSPICAETPCEDSFFAEPNDNRYLWTLPINMTAASARLRLKDLRDRRWIDLQTRELRVYLTVYNPAVDLFSAAELIFEPKQTGGVDVRATFKTFNMVRHILMLTEASKMFPNPNRNRNPNPNPNPNPDPNPKPNPNPTPIQASKMFPATRTDMGAMFAEMLFYLIALILWLQTLVEWREHGLFRFFLNFWRVLDLLN